MRQRSAGRAGRLGLWHEHSKGEKKETQTKRHGNMNVVLRTEGSVSGNLLGRVFKEDNDDTHVILDVRRADSGPSHLASAVETVVKHALCNVFVWNTTLR